MMGIIAWASSPIILDIIVGRTRSFPEASRPRTAAQIAGVFTKPLNIPPPPPCAHPAMPTLPIKMVIDMIT